MNRRNFLKTAIPLASAPFLVNGISLTAFARTSQSEQTSDNVLVLIQLNGGNDGLNTITPFDQYANLRKARQNIMIPENKILKINDSRNNGFHPSMSEILNLYQEEKVGIVQSVGYPNPNFSHFRSTDIVTSASESDEVIQTGWLGRWISGNYPSFPENFPNEQNPDPFAITVGSLVSATCQGTTSNVGIAVSGTDIFYQQDGGSSSYVPDTYGGDELKFIRDSQRKTKAYLNSVTKAAEKATNLSNKYPEEKNKLADQLKIVAQLIAGGLQTQIYVVSLGGFDTHANQVSETEGVLVGDHANLLRYISQAMHGFQDDLKLLGLEDRVLTMTFSEFGRRIASNSSFGTDHGAAAPLFVFGTAVNPIIHGENPTIADEVLPKDNLPMLYDIRSVYGSILTDWLGVPKEELKNILFDDFEHLPILKNGRTEEEEEVTALESEITKGQDLFLQNYPNPFTRETLIKFHSPSGRVRLSIYDSQGREIKILVRDNLPKGEHQVHFSAQNLPSGMYYARLQTRLGRTVRSMVLAR